VLSPYATGLGHHDQPWGAEMQEPLERLKWLLWHGHLDKALETIEDLKSVIDTFEEMYPKCKPWRSCASPSPQQLAHPQ
jgi:hypothetical protein